MVDRFDEVALRHFLEAESDLKAEHAVSAAGYISAYVEMVRKKYNFPPVRDGRPDPLDWKTAKGNFVPGNKFLFPHPLRAALMPELRTYARGVVRELPL